MQDQESVEKLGIDFQRLARKAYLSTGETEFDRMLKGKFIFASEMAEEAGGP
jgi:hypothetical protein